MNLACDSPLYISPASTISFKNDSHKVGDKLLVIEIIILKMVFKLAVIAALLVLVSSRDVCKVYTCSKVEDGKNIEYCATRDHDDFDVWNVQPCAGENRFCKTFAGKTPDALQYPAYCEEIKPEGFFPWWIIFGKGGNGVDGDYCETNKDCHHSYYTKGSCIDNMCHASTREDSKCKKSIDCPMDHFCNSKNRCTKALEPGQNCKREYECGRAHSCLKLVEHGDENICIPNNYLEDGVLFAFADTGFFNEENGPSHLMKEEDTSFLDGGKITPTLSLYCESVNHVQLGKNLFQCRKADKNMKNHLSRKLPAKNCLIETYSDVNPKNFDVKTNYTEESLCGFNKDSRAWCPLKLGDKLAQKYYRNWSEKMKSLKCSKFSKNDPESGSVCYEYHKAIEEKDEDLFSYNKLQATVISEGSAQVWANTANNNRCVAETLTFDFWNGHYGSFDDSFH